LIGGYIRARTCSRSLLPVPNVAAASGHAILV
jgi:hypothetical protein